MRILLACERIGEALYEESSHYPLSEGTILFGLESPCPHAKQRTETQNFQDDLHA